MNSICHRVKISKSNEQIAQILALTHSHVNLLMNICLIIFRTRNARLFSFLNEIHIFFSGQLNFDPFGLKENFPTLWSDIKKGMNKHLKEYVQNLRCFPVNHAYLWNSL